MSEIGEGVFLSIAPDEKELFWSIITEAGYPADAEGVKQFIFEGGVTSPRLPGDRLMEIIEDNPELAHLIKHAGRRIIKNVVKGLRL